MKKLIRRFVRDKRAITPVLSHLLLTVIAVAVMSIATSATFVITTNLRENMSERMIVEDVWFNGATHTIDVYVHNVGKASIQVSAVYVNHVGRLFNSPFRLGLNEHGGLSLVTSWNVGDVYYIDIVTTRGTHVAGYYKAV
jgi:Flp pilus assembly pilin Flp